MMNIAEGPAPNRSHANYDSVESKVAFAELDNIIKELDRMLSTPFYKRNKVLRKVLVAVQQQITNVYYEIGNKLIG